MKLLLSLFFMLGLSITGLLSCSEVSVSGIPPVTPSGLNPVKKTMRNFGSEQELVRFLRELAEKSKRDRRAEMKQEATNTAAPAATPADEKSKDAESITNVQHAGVDEGGIVKVHGNHLVVLRRGRLFTVAIGDGDLKPVSAVDAFGPDIDPSGTWYDEMLVSGDTIVVMGYSYQRGGTEVGLFNIDPDGHISYRSTYHLRSNDYYSSRNYASRLIGSKLIYYTPLYLSPEMEDPFASFPAVRKWRKGATPQEFRRIVPATQVYRSEGQLNSDYGLALHTVTVCDLANGGFDCKATAVVASPGRVFYVSPDAVYVWASSWVYQSGQTRTSSQLFRMPLDGSGPSALGVAGGPVDQFSFLQSGDQHLNVLVRSDGSGDGMWAAEYAAGDVALMRVPISDFSDGSEVVPSSKYRKLLKPEGHTFQNRFVGDYLIYGTGSGWGHPENNQKSNLFLVRWARGDSHQLSLPHGVDRIEQMGGGSVIVGTDGRNLHLPPFVLAIGQKSHHGIPGRKRRKVNCGVMASFTNLMAKSLGF